MIYTNIKTIQNCNDQLDDRIIVLIQNDFSKFPHFWYIGLKNVSHEVAVSYEEKEYYAIMGNDCWKLLFFTSKLVNPSNESKKYIWKYPNDEYINMYI